MNQDNDQGDEMQNVDKMNKEKFLSDSEFLQRLTKNG